MLDFYSASARSANATRAVDECMDIIFGDEAPVDGGIWIFNAGIGFDVKKIATAIRQKVPQARILGTTCGGVIGREGVGEVLTSMAIMGIQGPETEAAYSSVSGFTANTSYEKGLELAKGLKEKLPGVTAAYLLTPGLDTNSDEVLKAFNEILPDLIISGGLSSDNYKGIFTEQYVNGVSGSSEAWVVGFADETLRVATRACHGFNAYGEPMTVTKAENNMIIELDNGPAWETYSAVSGQAEEYLKNALLQGGMAIKLQPELVEEYGSDYLLRLAVAHEDAPDVMFVSATIKEGEQYYLTTRDENRVFSEQEKALAALREDILSHSSDGKVHPVAVFQADCLARGRTLFGKVLKDEIIEMIQTALSDEGVVPPWLGMYGFGEYCPLGNKNTFHTYTTTLLVLYR
ncbi:MAG: FIST C-terminal domain-containing protein [Oscillospiraceae bacterium]|jgi:hypothetical protein|nr:FIST C-terminal domain-containing protein [Oscillospiraceae bacterium]